MAQQDVTVRSGVPVKANVTLQLAAETTTVNVHSKSADLLESVPAPHTNLERELFAELPSGSVGNGLSDVITLGSPGVVADFNGFFHPLAEHADTSFSIDNQPVNDKQSKSYSNQLPANVFQSVEVISGAPPPNRGIRAAWW